MNRKLIRPNMIEIKARMVRAQKPGVVESVQQTPSTNCPHTPSGNGAIHSAANNQQSGQAQRRKLSPPELTNAESYYYLKQMQAGTPMVVVLLDGEKIRGVIEWYDRHCLKINRTKEPNILLQKHSIKYLYKQEDEPRMRRARSEKEDGSDSQKDAESQLSS